MIEYHRRKFNDIACSQKEIKIKNFWTVGIFFSKILDGTKPEDVETLDQTGGVLRNSTDGEFKTSICNKNNKLR